MELQARNLYIPIFASVLTYSFGCARHPHKSDVAAADVAVADLVAAADVAGGP